MSIIDIVHPGYHGHKTRSFQTTSDYHAKDAISYARMRELATCFQSPQMIHANIRLIDAGQIENHSDCSIINPGAIFHNNQFQLLCRGEPHETVWFGDFLAHLATPLWCTFDETLNLQDCFPLHYPTLPPNSRPEDWRLFQYRGKLYTNHSVYTLLDRKRWIVRSRTSISEVDLKNRQLKLRCILDPPFPGSDEEKNWSFFVHNGSLMCIYSFRPYILLTVDLERGITEKILEANPKFVWHEKGKFIGNSTNLIHWNDTHYILFIHDFLEPKYGQRDRAYMQYGVLISKETLLPTSVIPNPLIIGGDEQGRHPGVHYTSALVNHKDKLYAFYGEADSHTSAVIFNTAALTSLFDEHDLYTFKKKMSSRNTMKGIDPRKGIIISFPRSGLNWLRYCIEYFTGLRTAGRTKLVENGDLAVYRTHNVTNSDEVPDSCDCPFYDKNNHPLHNKVILLLRDYQETFIRIAKDEDIDLSQPDDIREHVMPHFYKYFENIKAFDSFSGEKLLIRYPDLISDFSTVIKILDFLGLPCALDDFNLEYHRQQSLNIYDGQHKSFTKSSLFDFSFHKNGADPAIVDVIDNYAKRYYPRLLNRYFG